MKRPPYWTNEFLNWEEQVRGKERKDNELITVIGGKVKERVIGGNLNTLHGIWGIEYMPEIKQGDILFIEDGTVDIYTLERSLSLLKLGGVFSKVSGIILGKYGKFDERGTGRKPYEVLLEILNGQELPLLANFDCCHTHPMLTLPIGSEIELNATNKTITILSDWI